MTENEAIKVLEETEKHVKIITIDGKPTVCYTTDMVKAFETAIKALEEVQQYRAISAIEECRNYKHVFHMAEIALNHIEKEEAEIQALGGIEEFKALKDAEEQGRLLPYKIGDKFYEPIEWKNCVEECKISSFTIKADGSLKIRLSGTYGVFEITTDKIGKIVFFTKEEAEKELAKRKSK